jgi:NAD+ diphosphatase
MLGFTAVARAEQTIRLDTAEMAEAAWFTREEIRSAAARADGAGVPDDGARLQVVSPKLSISRYLIDVWLDAASADGGVAGVVES